MTARFFARVAFAAAILWLSACGAGDLIGGDQSGAQVEILSVEGQAVKSGNPVSVGDKMAAGETIKLEEQSAAVLKIGDRAAVRLGDAGKLVVDEISDSVVLMLDYGSLLSVVSPVGRKFHVITPAAVVGVRGTAFYVEARGPDQSYVCLCEGVLEINTEAETKEIRAATRAHHTPVMIGPDKKGQIAITGAEMVNHTNADIAALERAFAKR